MAQVKLDICLAGSHVCETILPQGEHTKRDKHPEGDGGSPLSFDVQRCGRKESERNVSKNLINGTERVRFFTDSRSVVPSSLMIRLLLYLFIKSTFKTWIIFARRAIRSIRSHEARTSE